MTDRENLEYLVYLNYTTQMISDRMACQLLNMNELEFDNFFMDYDVKTTEEQYYKIRHSVEKVAREIIGD